MKLDKGEVRNFLIKIAKQREFKTYKQLARHFGQVIRNDYDVDIVSNILGDISRFEHTKGNPLLSVLIYNDEANRPGSGFFDTAKELGRFNGKSEREKDEFAWQETSRVHEFWVHNSLPNIESQVSEVEVSELEKLNAVYQNAIPEEKERVVNQLERGTIAEKVKVLNDYRCQVCEALGQNPISFYKRNGEPYIEAHHVKPVSSRERGVLHIGNIITVGSYVESVKYLC